MFLERLVLPEGLATKSIVETSELVLDSAVARHLVQALRVRKGAEFRIGDGAGLSRLASVLEIERRSLKVSWLGKATQLPRPEPEIILCLAMIDPTDLRRAIEGAVESGVDRIVLFKAEYSNRAVPVEGSALWEKILKNIRSSAEQSRRPWVPALEACDDIMGFVAGLNAAVVAHGGEGVPSFARFCAGIALPTESFGALVGPEGGWSPKELAGFEDGGIPFAHLGDFILRARTAAPVVVNHLQLARSSAPIG